MQSLVSLLGWLDAVFYNSTGLLFVVLGVFLLIRLAGFPDLTADGSFTLGAALYSSVLIAGHGTLPALSLAALGGAAGGLLTWTINNRFGVGRVISGVLSMIILLLTAPYISGGSTKSLLHVTSFPSQLDAIDTRTSRALLGAVPFQLHLTFSGFWLLVFSGCMVVLGVFFTSRVGLRLRYTGSATSPVLVPRTEQRLLLLLALISGNSLIAVGGAIEAQRRGGYTNNMGTGILLVALAVLVLGESILKSRYRRDFLYLPEYAAGIVLGTVVYSVGIQVLLALRIDFVDLRLLSALLLLGLLAIAGRFHSSSTRFF